MTGPTRAFFGVLVADGLAVLVGLIVVAGRFVDGTFVVVGFFVDDVPEFEDGVFVVVGVFVEDGEFVLVVELPFRLCLTPSTVSFDVKSKSLLFP